MLTSTVYSADRLAPFSSLLCNEITTSGIIVINLIWHMFLGRCAYSRTDEFISRWFILDRKACRGWSHLWRKCRGLSFHWESGFDMPVLALWVTCQVNLNLLHFFREESFANYTLIPVDEEFSRGRGLDIGAHAWKKGDVLMFFCDVDIHFTLEFLNTFRLHTAPSRFVLFAQIHCIDSLFEVLFIERVPQLYSIVLDYLFNR